MNAVIHLTKAVKFKPQKCQSCFHIFLCSSNIWLRAQEEHTNYFARHISILEQTCSAKIGWQIFVNQSELISIATTIFYKMAAALARCTRSSGFPRRKDLWSFCFVAIVRIMVYYDFFTFFVVSHWWVLQVLSAMISQRLKFASLADGVNAPFYRRCEEIRDRNIN